MFHAQALPVCRGLCRCGGGVCVPGARWADAGAGRRRAAVLDPPPRTETPAGLRLPFGAGHGHHLVLSLPAVAPRPRPADCGQRGNSHGGAHRGALRHRLRRGGGGTAHPGRPHLLRPALRARIPFGAKPRRPRHRRDGGRARLPVLPEQRYLPGALRLRGSKCRLGYPQPPHEAAAVAPGAHRRAVLRSGGSPPAGAHHRRPLRALLRDGKRPLGDGTQPRCGCVGHARGHPGLAASFPHPGLTPAHRRFRHAAGGALHPAHRRHPVGLPGGGDAAHLAQWAPCPPGIRHAHRPGRRGALAAGAKSLGHRKRELSALLCRRGRDLPLCRPPHPAA